MHILLDAEVNGQSPIFSPGDLVSGLLVWDSDTSLSLIDKVHVSLECRAGQVGAYPQAGHSHFAALERRLFREKLVLDRSQPKGAEWRFEFHLPTTWPWYFQSLPLPPSGVYHYDHGFIRLDTSSLDRVDSPALEGVPDAKRALVIVYRLSVDGVEGKVSDKDRSTARHIVVRPSVATPPATTGTDELAFKTLNWQPSSSSINKLFKKVKGDQTTVGPSYKLDGTVVIPKSLWQGQHADIELSLSTSNNTPADTCFALKEVDIKLMANTDIGTGTRWKSSDSHPNEIGRLQRKTYLRLGRECSRVKLDVDLGLDALDVPSDYVPCFTSYAPGDHAEINHNHHLEIVVVLQDDNTGQTVSLKGTHVVSVHPRIRPTTTSTILGLAGEDSHTEPDPIYDDSALPPSYKEATQ